jgi:thiosulfate/3-mercaptopyruvate sulfurtransferase
MADPLVSAAWLAERLGRPDVQILDGSWFLPAENRSGHAEYLEAHIPGAVFFDIDANADHSVDLPHMLPTPEAFAGMAGRLGLSRDATVVAYDSFGVRAAARVWWTLRAMGFPNVRVLDGGLKAWRAAGLPLESGEVTPAPTTLAPLYDAELVRNVADVQAILDSQSAQVVDARGAARFRGEAPEPRAGLKSRNLPFDTLLTAEGTLKPAAELVDLFKAASVDLDQPIVTTCGSGVTASVLALGLARIGRERIPVYDGSWSEWGGLPGVPIVTGP